MKALYSALKAIAESDNERFKLYKSDLYEQDRDAIAHDLQNGDVWYWTLKACGTNLVLANKDSEYLQQLMRPDYAPERRHFLIHISEQYEQGFGIKEYSMAEIAGEIAKVRINPNRKPARKFLSEVLSKLDKQLNGSRLTSDFSADKGAVLYLSLTANSVTYITNSGLNRTLGMPFDINRPIGAYKIKITSDFGHAEMEQIKQGVFQRAVKSNLKKAA